MPQASWPGSGGCLRVGATLAEHPESNRPGNGHFRFDQADVDTRQSRGTLGDVVCHEVMHALGFGTIRAELGLVRSVTGENRFIGHKRGCHHDNRGARRHAIRNGVRPGGLRYRRLKGPRLRPDGGYPLHPKGPGGASLQGAPF